LDTRGRIMEDEANGYDNNYSEFYLEEE